MRDLIRQILQGYKSLNLEGQDEGYVQFSGQEPDTRQRVSIKILPRVLGKDPEIASRFSDLSRAIRQLNHPNITSIRKIGEESGLPYVVTRTIEKGHSLATKLDQPWAVDTAADVVEQVGQALEHAYRKGLVHGALTPENVMIQDDGRIMVTDFGLSELMELVGGSAMQAASPYLAPERVAGQPADASADVYSLAAILYGMLTKRQPQVVNGQVLPPSRFNPDLPEAMDLVLVKALAPSPSDRYPDIKTFLAAVAATRVVPTEKPRALARSGIRCPNCGAEEQTGRFCRKCGQRLRQPEPAALVKPSVEETALDEPIQVTRVEVGHIEVGKGIEMSKTIIARPMTVASSDLEVEFPEPVEMPQLDTERLWPSLGDRPMIAMPEPPEMPAIDWAEVAPPMPEVPKLEEASLAEEGD
jgi:serine/threonine protein kinase